MSLLDAQPDKPKRRPVFAWLGAVLVMLLAVLLWYNFRFLPETRAANRFFDALVAGDTAQAYKLWQPGASYPMQDFLADWGPNGYYGPVKSYRITRASSPHGGSGVIVTVEVSPFAPWPSREDLEKSRRTKVVSVWIETKDKSFSFPPPF